MSATDLLLPKQAVSSARLLDRVRGVLASHQPMRAVVTSAVRVFGIRLAGAALTYGSTVFLARWLGAHDFGVYAYVSVVVMLLGIALSFGFNSSALRFLSRDLARGRLNRVSGFLRLSYGLVVVLSIAGACICAAALVALRSTIDASYFGPLLVGLACVPLWALLNQLEATARAFGWVNVAYVPNYVVRPLLLIACVAAFVALGGAADAVNAVYALLGACACAVLAQGIIVFRRTRRHLAGAAPRMHVRAWGAASLGFLAVDAFRMLLDNTDLLLIGRFLDPHSVAIYFAVARTCSFVGFVSFSIIALAVPQFSALHAMGSREDMQRFVTRVAHMMFWPTLMVAVALAATGPFLLSLFGKGFEAGYTAMLAMLAGLVLRAATGPVEFLLNATGHQRDTLRVYAVAAAATVALNVLLVPAFGLVGAAVATYTAMLGANAWLYVLVRARLGIKAFVVPLRTPLPTT